MNDRRNEKSRYEPQQPDQTLFFNPYAFVFAPTREQYPRGSAMADAAPSGHASAQPAALQGTLTLEMRTETPLLMLDAASVHVDANGHRTFSCRRDACRAPLIPPTSLKGMLRSAYEAVTNSRLGIFHGHDDELFFRSATAQGIRAVPARIVDEQTLELLTGESAYGAKGPEPGSLIEDSHGAKAPMYAAWVSQKRMAAARLSHEIRHGDCVTAVVEYWEKYRLDKNSTTGKKFAFGYWRVISGPAPAHGPSTSAEPFAGPIDDPVPQFTHGAHRPKAGVGRLRITGYYFETGDNAPRRQDGEAIKHDERIFFRGSSVPETVFRLPFDDAVARRWMRLLKNCQDLAEDREKIKSRGGHTDPSAPREESRHCRERAARPRAGDLCYALLGEANGRLEVRDLVPVTLSRRMFRLPPAELLHASLHPSSDLACLSPAERVFGTVVQGGVRGKPAAYRGHVRISEITWQGEAGTTDAGSALEAFGDAGLPLAILGAPKPAQARFYTANRDGSAKWKPHSPSDRAPLTGEEERKLYEAGDALAGRKVYPHQLAAAAADYWNPAHGSTHEYLRAGRVRDSQNRSIRDWIRPQQTFRFRIAFENLTAFELGALLWLIGIDGARFRLGAGKPLGFGSVSLRLVTQDSFLESGETARASYAGLPSLQTPPWNEVLAADAIDAFERDSDAAGGGPVRAAFAAALRGFDAGHPVHYPRQQAMAPLAEARQGHIYQWFSLNRSDNGRRLPLAPLTGSGSDARQSLQDLLLSRHPGKPRDR